MVSVAGIEPTLQRPKRRVIPFHYTEKLIGCGGRIRTYDLQLMRLAGTADSPTPQCIYLILVRDKRFELLTSTVSG